MKKVVYSVTRYRKDDIDKIFPYLIMNHNES